MARISGVNIPTKKRVEIALTYIHGIGTTSAKNICAKAGVPDERRVNDAQLLMHNGCRPQIKCTQIESWQP